MDRFLIAPIKSGLQTDMKPWQIQDDAWAQLDNAYCFRGRVRKRFGSCYMGFGTGDIPQALSSRLAVLLINASTGLPFQTDAFGNVLGTVPGNKFDIGQGFSIGQYFYTVVENGTPGAMIRNDGVLEAAGFNTSNGDFFIDGGPSEELVYWYPALPVMGLTTFENGPVNDQPSYAFDTQFAYVFSSDYWHLVGTTNSDYTVTPQWHGTNINFFWTTNWQGQAGQVALFVSNFYVVNPNGPGTATDDPIWWTFDGVTWIPGTGANGFYFNPNGGAKQTGPFVKTALILLPFKGRLILLNTIENNGAASFGTNTQYVNRCRYSSTGSPFSQNSWYEPNTFDNSGTAGLNSYAGAGFIDASTEERIVSAEFIKDRLIVYFERSTWELAWTGNQIQPFQWNKINTELGSESTFSTVAFDKAVLTIGNTGVHACTGANVERIDAAIPDEIFQISSQLTNSGVSRVQGIRDYFVEMVYWTFPSDSENPKDTYPNRVLVFNYQNSTWAFNDDCITCFGYFEQVQSLTWENANFTWQSANFAWNSGSLEPQSRQVIAGNQQGFVFMIQADENQNAAVMQLTDMSQYGHGLVQMIIIDHTLQNGDYIAIYDNEQPIVDALGNPQTIFKVFLVQDSDTILISNATLEGGDYTGGAYIARVSNIRMLSKQWNPYVKDDRNFHLAKIDFGVFKTTNGQITVDYYPSYTEFSMLTQASGNSMILGNGILETSAYPLYPLETMQTLLWHPIYFQTDGEAIQIYLYFTDVQITNPQIAFSPFELEGMVLYTQPTTARLQ